MPPRGEAFDQRGMARDRVGVGGACDAVGVGHIRDLLLDEPYRVSDGVHGIGIFIFHFDVELVFEVENDVDQPRRVHLEVLQDVRFLVD